MAPARYSRGKEKGFTMRELLALVTVMLLASLVAIPSMGRLTDRTQALQCLNNLQALARGFHLYTEDNKGIFPRNPPNIGSTFNSADWSTGYVDWTTSPQNTNPGILSQLPFSGYLPGVQVYRCPSESDLRVRGQNGPRIRSYSMNTYVGKEAYAWYQGYRIYEKVADLVSPTPADLLVLWQEHPDSINDSRFIPPMGSPSLLDWPASIHDGAGTVSFADGHCEFRLWNPQTRLPIRFNLVVSGGGSPADVKWLQAKGSARLP